MGRFNCGGNGLHEQDARSSESGQFKLNHKPLKRQHSYALR